MVDYRKIERLRIRKGLSIAEFCKQSGVSIYIYKKILKGQDNFMISACFKIAKYFNLEVFEIMV